MIYHLSNIRKMAIRWTIILHITILVVKIVLGEDASSLPLEHRGHLGPYLAPQGSLGSVNDIGSYLAPAGSYGPPNSDDAWALNNEEPAPRIKNLQVQCEKTHMRVNVEFDRPFYGTIFSKNHFSDPQCVHLKPGTGLLSANFEIYLNTCGMTGSSLHDAHLYENPAKPSNSFVENTIIIQYDPFVQEVWDLARKLRCTWYDFYEKSVQFKPFQVDMLHAVTANFLGDNLQCWMQIQVSKGPWASEVSGIVKIGQTMTMVLAIKDDERRFDMLVRDCLAHDGHRAPIQLVDRRGCVSRPRIMSGFQKIRDFGPSATVVSYAYFQAFKFPDAMSVHFQCVIQVCRDKCPEPDCGGGEHHLHHNLLQQQALGGHYPPPQQVDPRHPLAGGAEVADPLTGAYSENHPEKVLLQPDNISKKGDYIENVNEVYNANSDNSNNKQQNYENLNYDNQQKQNQNNYDAVLNNNYENKRQHPPLPPPPPPGSDRNTYSTVDGNGGPESEHISTLGGRPRSVETRERRSLDQGTFITIPVSVVHTRQTRDVSASPTTDVTTKRVIRVVAPNDVDFSLNAKNNAQNETVIIETMNYGKNAENICLSIQSFVSGLISLLLIIIVASLIAGFLFVRVRVYDRKIIN
ncbi:uncharacterized protein LOC113383032 [Ctenocephalides felis]|uniref:uncharacterized protein LOC113383032 n=1 Tax=Ctenocephalides felis TaxID=7515 RepID=UPI000E6E5789|nr:uncharacterized protein LOC113383032 [Ctenocephalides felis]